MVKRSNSHVFVGLGFVGFAVAIAGAVYGGMKYGTSERSLTTGNMTEAAPATNTPQPAVMPQSDRQTTQAQATSAPSIEGTWILAEWGGEDGLSRCSDYASPALYKRNHEMGEVADYAADGSYKSYFAYTTPGGEEHYTHYSATWEQERSKLVLLNFAAEDAFRNESPREDRSMVFNGPNVVRIDDRRYVRCIGETGLDGA